MAAVLYRSAVLIAYKRPNGARVIRKMLGTFRNAQTCRQTFLSLLQMLLRSRQFRLGLRTVAVAVSAQDVQQAALPPLQRADLEAKVSQLVSSRVHTGTVYTHPGAAVKP